MKSSNMNYSQALEYIHSFLKFGSKPGLERVSALLEENGCPQNELNIIHVAGTNGKGSVSAMIAKSLTLSGKKIGLFTSPYVSDFCERIQIDGEMISHQKLTELVEKYSKQIKKLNSLNIFPTEFELITAMAFDFFKQENCDYVVMEVGLGGLYDSTNVVRKPVVSVITHIDLDHSEVLGKTVGEIASQKCGIIKDGCPCVLYPEQYREVFTVVENECKKRTSKLIVPDTKKLKNISTDNLKTSFSYNNEEYCLGMIGDHQALNAVTAIEALKIVGCEERYIKAGISQAALPARIEVISRDPLVILDGAHNPDGAKALSRSIKSIGGYVAVVSVMRDKDVGGCLKYLLKNAKKTVATKCVNPRAMDENDLAELCKKYCKDVFCVGKAEQAVDHALKNNDGLPVVICGSLYLASEVRDFIYK